MIDREIYKLVNTVTGWFVFLIAAIVYLLTIEPTVSFWDCGEFIASGYKLEVGHPPGAAFFMLLVRFFSLFASSPAQVPLMANVLSALASAFTILFLFWTITHLTKKVLSDTAEISYAKIITIIGSGIVGALAYTFSDTFWFSAVEAEVYATSSLFTAIVFWAILKWENEAGQPGSSRWLIFIAFLMGISIGIHLLNLLTIPAIALVYYLKEKERKNQSVDWKGIMKVLIFSGVFLYAMMAFFIQGIVFAGSRIELLFVNQLNLFINSGLLFFVLTLYLLLAFAIFYTYKNKMGSMNIIANIMLVFLLGYSVYAMIIIRSSANPPMDQNNPENPIHLLSYLSREQYGETPLLYGPYYNAEPEHGEGKNIYRIIDGQYKVVAQKPNLEYDDAFSTIFPRMWSSDPGHVQVYKNWGKVKGQKVKTAGGIEVVPRFSENLGFFFRYQCGWMYWRYFMWNFAGRQNDIQGHGNVVHGNWLSGIKWLDEWRLGSQENLPENFRNNKGRNTYYLLPLLLGLIGCSFHLIKRKKDFFVIFLLFFMTGLAIVIYLNQNPYQPRERDYAYAGSFYAFAIWIGMGVAALVEWIRVPTGKNIKAIAVFLLALVFVPGIMAVENWDDHDRSGRYTVREFARNYLNSCAPNAIIFTNGDNDTFPLWYIQQVEGVRTDVRVINLSYLGADWYIEQMQRKAYASDPVPMSVHREDFLSGTNDVTYVVERTQDRMNVQDAINFIIHDTLDGKSTKLQAGQNRILDYMPTRKLSFPVDTQKVVANNTVHSLFQDRLVSEIDFTYPKNFLLKNDLMLLDIIASNAFDRPIYFALTVSQDNHIGLSEYLELHGLAYRLVPVKHGMHASGEVGGVNTEILYENLMNQFTWGNAADPNIYLDEDNIRMVSNFRNLYLRLAEDLYKEGKSDSAKKVLDRSLELFPNELVEYNFFILGVAELYYHLGERERAKELTDKMYRISREYLIYYHDPGKKMYGLNQEKKVNLYVMQQSIQMMHQMGYMDKVKQMNQEFSEYVSVFQYVL